jgi:hypothetical protein
VAALIESHTGLKAEVVEGGRGEFTVWVGDEKVAQKSAEGFPTEQEALAAVQKALTRGEPGR